MSRIKMIAGLKLDYLILNAGALKYPNVCIYSPVEITPPVPGLMDAESYRDVGLWSQKSPRA